MALSSTSRPFASVYDFGRRIWHESRLQVQCLTKPKRRPSLVVFPSNQPWDAASNLRAWLVAPELEKLGWRVVVVPAPLSLSQRRRVLASEKPDVVLIQQTRHALNDPALYHPTPCVLDIDDADFLDPQHHSRITRWVESAAAVVYGSHFLADSLRTHNPNAHIIWTGTPDDANKRRIPPQRREPIVAWAHSDPLHYPVEADLMQRVMTDVIRRTGCTFWLFGTTEDAARAWLEPLRQAGGHSEAIPTLHYAEYLARVGHAAVGLHPVCIENEFSRGKSFGKLLAYLAEQVAVVTTNVIDHPLFFRDGNNGRLVENDAQSWANAIVDLISDPKARSDIAMQGYRDFRERLTTRKFAGLLNRVLRTL